MGDKLGGVGVGLKILGKLDRKAISTRDARTFMYETGVPAGITVAEKKKILRSNQLTRNHIYGEDTS